MSKMTKQEALSKLEENNNRLAKILKGQNVSKVNMICCGNSISSGYSMSSFTKPLLFRNENIQEILKENSIDLSRYHFARAEDNNDEHIYSWLINNTKLSDICKLNRFDIKPMNVTGVDETNIDELYPLDDNTTIKGLLLDDKASNIIIYNGATGSFLDNVTRGGKHFLTYGIKRDCVSIESFLKYIQEYNRCNNKTIQVYLCGAPSILKASDIFINLRLEVLATNYANVTYVENIPKKLLYKKESGGIIPDTHYDEIEYLELNNKILESINENYLINEILIKIDNQLYFLNNSFQNGSIGREYLSEIADKIIINTIEQYKESLEQADVELESILLMLKDYLLERVQYDFYYIGKKTIKESVKKLEK